MSKPRSFFTPPRWKPLVIYTSLTLITLAMLAVGYFFITHSPFYLYLEQVNPANHKH